MDQRWETLSLMSTCTDPIQVKKGDQMTVTAYYDLNLHPLSVNWHDLKIIANKSAGE
jgi:hypothetical protein